MMAAGPTVGILAVGSAAGGGLLLVAGVARGRDGVGGVVICLSRRPNLINIPQPMSKLYSNIPINSQISGMNEFRVGCYEQLTEPSEGRGCNAPLTAALAAAVVSVAGLLVLLVRLAPGPKGSRSRRGRRGNPPASSEREREREERERM